MDSVVERIISLKLGPKWVQLYSRLNLGPRDRFRIETAHSGKNPEERFACCVRDTINKWRATLATSVDEEEAIRRLLCALERVQGYEDVTSDIASAYDIMLHPTSSSEDDSPKFKRHPTENSSRSESASSGSQQCTFSKLGKAQVVDVNHRQLQNSFSKIDITNRAHKYAILDICQLLHGEKWEQFALTLRLPRTTIGKIRAELASEERYYLTIKGWVSGAESHSFYELREVLKMFGNDDAFPAIEERLGSITTS